MFGPAPGVRGNVTEHPAVELTTLFPRYLFVRTLPMRQTLNVGRLEMGGPGESSPGTNREKKSNLTLTTYTTYDV